MSRFSMFFLTLLLAGSGIIGCGGGSQSDEPTEGAPPPPQAGTDDYDQYSSAGRGGPGSNPAAKK